ncbi:DUF3127 domain-containing protein [Chitinophaga sp.]|uniref:DUF3127 domain-containing protein n=1 Tax=Chitinophaga sp. TaxID=1869181 RepID=UPI0031E25DFE
MSDQAKIVLKGRIKNIFPSEIFGNFEKRVMWLEEQDVQYPQTYEVQFTQGDCNVLDGFQPGQMVECHINLRGRHSEKSGKEYVFNSLQCWRIKKLANAEPVPTETNEPAQAADLGYAPAASSDDLPF